MAVNPINIMRKESIMSDLKAERKKKLLSLYELSNLLESRTHRTYGKILLLAFALVFAITILSSIWPEYRRLYLGIYISTLLFTMLAFLSIGDSPKSNKVQPNELEMLDAGGKEFLAKFVAEHPPKGFITTEYLSQAVSNLCNENHKQRSAQILHAQCLAIDMRQA